MIERVVGMYAGSIGVPSPANEEHATNNTCTSKDDFTGAFGRRWIEQGLKGALYQREGVYVPLKEIVNSRKRSLCRGRLFSRFFVFSQWISGPPRRMNVCDRGRSCAPNAHRVRE
jgi:hypothetical protein